MKSNSKPMADSNGPSKTAPPRPTISLPPRSSIENFFARGSDGSPGPMTLVSSFFSENEPDSDCRSFSQLLAGAMASPVAAAPGRNLVFSRDGAGGGDEGGFGFKQSRPMGLVIAQSPLFTVPPGLSPATLLDSPGFFSTGCQSPFGISHQQALAQVTAQAAQFQPHALIQAEYPSKSVTTATSLAHRIGPAAADTSLQQMQTLTSDSKNSVMESAEVSHSDQRSQPASLTVDKPADDGYNWRKYGQKQVKGSEYPRSYYKCTYPNCPVKKKVERSLDGQVTEIIYKGQHNHQRPQPSRRAKEVGPVRSGSAELNGNLDLLMNSEKSSQDHGGIASHSMSRKDQEFSQTTPEQLSGSSDGEEVGDGEVRADEGVDNEPDPKRRNIDPRVLESGPSHKTVTEPRIIVQTTSEVDLLDDGYRWRKYGQKVVKGNPYPRSYYKCTSAGCTVRKHVERASTDPKAVITTYEGKHNHDVPAAKTSSHNTAIGGTTNNSLQLKPHRTVSSNQSRMDFRNNDGQPVELLRFKEEHDIT